MAKPPLVKAIDESLTVAPAESARQAGLRYVSDAKPGIVREGEPGNFRYRGPDGKLVKDGETLARIRSLAIPPAYTEVWICPRENGHLQASGRDARGRKQYRYHPRWREVRDETKFDRLIAFAEALPALRRRAARDLKLRGLPRAKVLAAVVILLDTTFIRVGNEEYARTNKSYGLTTLRRRHAQVKGDKIRLHFRGKSGKMHRILVNSPQMARIIRKCQDLPGQELFHCIDGEGQVTPIDSGDVNAYLQEVTGQPFTAKDFRTWAGTVLMYQTVCGFPVAGSKTAGTRQVKEALEGVAKSLGNTPRICRNCYVHPGVINACMAGALNADEVPPAMRGLRKEERAAYHFLRHLPAA